MSSKLFFNLSKISPRVNATGGSLTYVTSKEVSGFVNIAFASLKLAKQGFQEPIWHPNANKIGYCLEGEAMISIRSPGKADNFSVKAGDIFFIPQGFVHDIVNIGNKELSIVFAFNNGRPEEMVLSKAIHSLSESVFTDTFKTTSDFYKGMTSNKKTDVIKTLASIKTPSKSISSPFKFNIASSDKTILTQGGYLQVGTKPNLPILDGLGVLGFGLNPKGAVEPHWHTNAGELVYIVKGETRITVLAPDGTVEVLEVNGGQGAFAAASHFHNIENVGDEDVEVIAFFNHAEPDYIGIGEVVGAYSNNELSAIFNVAPNYFDALSKTDEPLVIVPL